MYKVLYDKNSTNTTRSSLYNLLWKEFSFQESDLKALEDLMELWEEGNTGDDPLPPQPIPNSLGAAGVGIGVVDLSTSSEFQT